MTRQTSESKIRDRETWSPQLDWYLNCRDAACGVQSSFASQVAAIERGGAGGGGQLGEDGSYVHPYNDSQVTCVKHGPRAFAMDRRMRTRWLATLPADRDLFFVHYTGAMPSGANGQDGRQRWPKGVESRLGEFGGVALFLAQGEKRIRLLKACEKGNEEALKGHAKRAEQAVREAHRRYYALTDQEALDWVEDRPTGPPGIHNIHEAPEPWWAGGDMPSAVSA